MGTLPSLKSICVVIGCSILSGFIGYSQAKKKYLNSNSFLSVNDVVNDSFRMQQDEKSEHQDFPKSSMHVGSLTNKNLDCNILKALDRDEDVLIKGSPDMVRDFLQEYYNLKDGPLKSVIYYKIKTLEEDRFNNVKEIILNQLLVNPNDYDAMSLYRDMTNVVGASGDDLSRLRQVLPRISNSEHLIEAIEFTSKNGDNLDENQKYQYEQMYAPFFYDNNDRVRAVVVGLIASYKWEDEVNILSNALIDHSPDVVREALNAIDNRHLNYPQIISRLDQMSTFVVDEKQKLYISNLVARLKEK